MLVWLNSAQDMARLPGLVVENPDIEKDLEDVVLAAVFSHNRLLPIPCSALLIRMKTQKKKYTHLLAKDCN
jgi:hypothetical protein